MLRWNKPSDWLFQVQRPFSTNWSALFQPTSKICLWHWLPRAIAVEPKGCTFFLWFSNAMDASSGCQTKPDSSSFWKPSSSYSFDLFYSLQNYTVIFKCRSYRCPLSFQLDIYAPPSDGMIKMTCFQAYKVTKALLNRTCTCHWWRTSAWPSI